VLELTRVGMLQVELLSAQGCYPPPPAVRLHVAVNVATAASHSSIPMKHVWPSVATPCPGPWRCEREVHLATSSNTDLDIPWQVFCRTGAYCRHPSFETTFDDTNEAPARHFSRCIVRLQLLIIRGILPSQLRYHQER
jgi:hypothetical protein